MTPAEMRAEIFRWSYEDPIVRNCFAVADRDGLSGEDRFTLLAYHALRVKKEAYDMLLERAKVQPMPHMILVDAAPASAPTP